MNIQETIASLKERIEAASQKIEQSRSAIYLYYERVSIEEHRMKSYQKYRDELCKQLDKYAENLESRETDHE